MSHKSQQHGFVITPQDEKNALAQNIKIIRANLQNASDKKFEEFLRANYDVLESLFELYSPKIFQTPPPPFKAIRTEVLKTLGHATPEIVENLNLRNTLGIKRLISAEDIGRERERAAANDALYAARRQENFRSATNHFKNGIANLLHTTVSLARLPYTLAQATLLPSWNILAGTLDTLQVPRYKRWGAAATLAGGLTAAGAMVEVDSAPYKTHLMPQDQIQKVCLDNPEILTKGHASNALYATDFAYTIHNDAQKVYIHPAMVQGARHGVPAIALHLISHYETIGFRDLVANNSSATGPFQIIDSTKALYLKAYGKDTFFYKESEDPRVRHAIDAVSGMSQKELLDAVKINRLPPNIFYALSVLANDPALQAELVALDLKRHMPEITNPNLAMEEIHERAALYYIEHHMLGLKNYADLEELANEDPTAKVKDKFSNIVEANPDLLSPEMTAGEALEAIQERFKDRTQRPFIAFNALVEKGYDAQTWCLSEEARALEAKKISLAEAVAIELDIYEPIQKGIKTLRFMFTQSNAAVENIFERIYQASGQKPSSPVQGNVSEHAPRMAVAPSPRPRPYDISMK